MRVMPNKILVRIKTDTTDSLVTNSQIRTGIVFLSGVENIAEKEEILFGENFEEIEINKDLRASGHRYYLMDKDNIKIIYDEKDNDGKVLPFLKR